MNENSLEDYVAKRTMKVLGYIFAICCFFIGLTLMAIPIWFLIQVWLILYGEIGGP